MKEEDPILKEQLLFAVWVLRVLRIFLPILALMTAGGFCYSLYKNETADAVSGLIAGVFAVAFLSWCYRYVRRWQQEHTTDQPKVDP